VCVGLNARIDQGGAPRQIVRRVSSTLVAGCVFLGPVPVRAGSTQLPSRWMNPRQIEQMEKCDAISTRRLWLDNSQNTPSRSGTMPIVPSAGCPLSTFLLDAGKPTTTGRQCSTISRARCLDWATPHTNVAPRHRWPWSATGNRLGAADPTPTSRNEIRRFLSKRLEEAFAR
jgi:hypothetical protein